MSVTTSSSVGGSREECGKAELSAAEHGALVQCPNAALQNLAWTEMAFQVWFVSKAHIAH